MTTYFNRTFTQLSQLTDVSLGTPTAGQVLTYTSAGKWANATLPTISAGSFDPAGAAAAVQTALTQYIATAPTAAQLAALTAAVAGKVTAVVGTVGNVVGFGPGGTLTDLGTNLNSKANATTVTALQTTVANLMPSVGGSAISPTFGSLTVINAIRAGAAAIGAFTAVSNESVIQGNLSVFLDATYPDCLLSVNVNTGSSFFGDGAGDYNSTAITVADADGTINISAEVGGITVDGSTSFSSNVEIEGLLTADSDIIVSGILSANSDVNLSDGLLTIGSSADGVSGQYANNKVQVWGNIRVGDSNGLNLYEYGSSGQVSSNFLTLQGMGETTLRCYYDKVYIYTVNANPIVIGAQSTLLPNNTGVIDMALPTSFRSTITANGQIGVSGSFTSSNGKTVTVTNGIVTGIN